VGDDLRGKIFGNLSFAELSLDDLTQLRRDNARMWVVFPEILTPNKSKEK
jgi:hypothetical protein